ncbi:MAG TPA: hypothetical protein VFW96_07525 [Thermomicrobiales bacterium]|nr:hypothetical protein [Thermomicrobiales bacterium]
MHDHTAPPTFHTDLATAYGEVEITLGDEPTIAFSRSPFGFTRPLPADELRELAAGRFGPGLDAQLHACTLPPDPPLADADRARIVALAAEAWAAGAEHAADPGQSGAGAATERATDGGSLDRAGEPPISSVAEAGAPVPAPVPTADVSAADALRALQHAGEDDVVAADVASTATSPPPARPAARRALTVRLTLRPAGASAYRALVGVGADGCDPQFRALGDALPLDTVLAAVPAAVAAAEARWLATPRYPAASAAPAAPTKARAASAKAANPATPEPAAGAPVAATPAPATARPAPKQQLDLFG